MADGAIKTPIGKIDNLPIEINGIIVPIKVLIMEAIQYQALRNQNLSGKPTKYRELKKSTMSCHQYSLGTTMGKESKQTNLPGKPTI
ncbi:hypothetical protein G9A89_019506 [Geosiphon pyriformis]|nr:hypothetical protein G9A89_019506 [Geosiphon pyriformis]